ncbi:MAG: hypothetical protein AB2A00_26390 [Myxococcota bacterium]
MRLPALALSCGLFAAACTPSTPSASSSGGLDAGPGTVGSSSSNGAGSTSSSSTGGASSSSSGASSSSSGAANTSSSGAASSSSSGAGSSSGGSSGTPTFHQDIRPILAEHCWMCHGTQRCYGAPMSLVTYADTQEDAPSGLGFVYERMAERTSAVSNAMPPGAPLDSATRDIIRRWAEAGAPEGTPVSGGPQPPPDCNHDAPDAGPPTLVIRAHDTDVNAPYPVPDDPDRNVYSCFGFTVPDGAMQHITRFEPELDAAEVVHHMVLYRDQGWDGTNVPDGPFGCGDDDGSMQADWSFMYGWAPGTTNFSFPADVGMPMAPGARLVLQVHYHPTPGASTVDRSGVRIYATTELRPNEAGMVAVGPTGFSATAAQPAVSADCSNPATVSGFPVTMPDTWIFAAFPHMHNHGLNIRAERWRGGQLQETFGAVDNWAFDSQPNLPTDVHFRNGDTIRVTCTYTGFDGDQPVNFGERTEEEMCYQFLYHSPPLRVSAFSGTFDVSFCPIEF